MFAKGSMIKNREIENIADGITQVNKLYLHRGFNITHMHTDCEFEPLRKEMTALGINLNCASKNEHVPEIDCFIQTFKKRIRSARATTPLKRISNLTKVHLVASATFCLNKIPPSTPGAGLSDTKVPGNVILGNTIDNKKFYCLQLEEYVQVHQEDEPKNTIAINRTVGAISLRSQYNLQGGNFLEPTNR